VTEDAIPTKPRASRRWTWIIRGILWTIVILVISALGSCTVLVETPVHFVLGWFFHAAKTLPSLLGNWRPLVAPLGCLVLATWLVHRFVRWWQVAKGKTPSWRLRHTCSAVALLLLGSGAAIALSGVVHQVVWLLSDPWMEDRGKRAELTMAVNNGRQLMLALLEFHQTKGRYPYGFHELELPQDLMWVQTSNRSVREPFILLHPGGRRFVNADEPLIVSPVIQREGKFVVGYGDGSVRSLPAVQLGKILRTGGQGSPQLFPVRE
jgi:hypothetical protein